jgi:hypothetical protein
MRRPCVAADQGRGRDIAGREQPNGIASGCSCVDVSRCTPLLSSGYEQRGRSQRPADGTLTVTVHICTVIPRSAQCCIKLYVLLYHGTEHLGSLLTYATTWHIEPSLRSSQLHTVILFLRHSCTSNSPQRTNIDFSTFTPIPYVPNHIKLMTIEEDDTSPVQKSWTSGSVTPRMTSVDQQRLKRVAQRGGEARGGVVKLPVFWFLDSSDFR